MRYARSLVITAVLATALYAVVGGQGVVVTPARFQALDATGAQCAGCLLYTYAAGTTTNQTTYADSALTVPHENPIILNSAGQTTIYVSPTLAYKYVLRTSAGVELWTVDNVLGPFSGVISITAANARGLQISRTSADAGLSLSSSGGSGKTYGMVSTTTGTLVIQDDADASPGFQLGPGEAITAVTTGVFTVSGGRLAATGTGNHDISGSSTTGNDLRVRNTNSGTGAYSGVTVGNDTSATAGWLYQTSSGYTPLGYNVASGTHLLASQAGGLSVVASHAAGDIRFYTGGSTTPALTIDDTGLVTIGRLAGGVFNPTVGTTNDANIGAASVIIFNSGLSGADLTGIAGGINGRQIWAVVSGSNSLVLQHEDTGSTAANRFTSLTGADITVTNAKAVQMIYDGYTSRWLVFDTK